MSALLLPSRLRQQPQQGAQLDRSNRFAANALAIITASQDINHATGKQLVRGGTGYAGMVRPAGRTWAFRKNFYVQTEALPAIGTQSFVEFWYGYPSATLYSSNTSPGFLTGSESAQVGIAGSLGDLASGSSTQWGAVYNWGAGGSNALNPSGEVLTPGELTLLVIVRRQSGMELWRNGRLIRFIAQSPISYPSSVMYCGTFVSASYWASQSDTLLAGRVLTPIEPTTAETQAFSENPWALWQAPRDRAALAAVSAYSPVVADTSISGSGIVVASASGALSTAIRMSGGAASAAVGSGTLNSAIRLAGVGAVVSSGAGVLSTGIRLAGVAAATSTATATLGGTAAGLAGTAASSAIATGALSTRIALTGIAAAVAAAVGRLSEQAPVGIDVSKIHPSRIVVFEGSGSRIVTFEGSGPRMRIAQMSLNMPTKDGEKWKVDRDPDEESWYGAEITAELRDRNTTAKSVELVLLGVDQLAEPTIQVVTIDGVSRTFIAAFLGGIDGAPPEGWKWIARVRCANGERFDKTTWFNEVDP
jgi:hypothetical protein